MRYLYVLLLLSLAVILWTVWAIRRHVRRHPGTAGDEQRDPGDQEQQAAKATDTVITNRRAE